MYIVFDLDPSLAIQDGFSFAVSELHLCRTTERGNCSERLTIVTVRVSIAKIFVFL